MLVQYLCHVHLERRKMYNRYHSHGGGDDHQNNLGPPRHSWSGHQRFAGPPPRQSHPRDFTPGPAEGHLAPRYPPFSPTRPPMAGTPGYGRMAGPAPGPCSREGLLPGTPHPRGPLPRTPHPRGPLPLTPHPRGRAPGPGFQRGHPSPRARGHPPPCPRFPPDGPCPDFVNTPNTNHNDNRASNDFGHQDNHGHCNGPMTGHEHDPNQRGRGRGRGGVWTTGRGGFCGGPGPHPPHTRGPPGGPIHVPGHVQHFNHQTEGPAPDQEHAMFNDDGMSGWKSPDQRFHGNSIRGRGRGRGRGGGPKRPFAGFEEQNVSFSRVFYIVAWWKLMIIIF